jgi:N-acetylmuramoyl-L-alanine amidase
MTALAWLLLLPATALSHDPDAKAVLPARVQRIVLHTLGGPFYRDPDRRFRFFSPPETFALWKERFGAHWIVAPDGSLWPRHPRNGEPGSRVPPTTPADAAWAARLAREAAPVYAHVQGANDDSVGIELAHSGRSDDPFPAEQVRTVAWLVRALLSLSHGRLDATAVVGHKDLDKRPAYEPDSCRGSCPFFADEAGRAYRRRVDPPESLFVALAGRGLAVPREGREDDKELVRAEAIPHDRVPTLIR